MNEKTLLSTKLIEYFENNAFIKLNEGQIKKLIQALEPLNISRDTQIFEFQTWSSDFGYHGRLAELYDIGWHMMYSEKSYLATIRSSHEHLGLPEPYIPLDSFEGGGGFFYNRETGEVLELEFGEMLNDFHAGKLKPQFKDFNIFLEWFFELRDNVSNTSLDYEKARHEANLKHKKQAQIRLERKLAQKCSQTKKEN